jgi:hypothetical protein
MVYGMHKNKLGNTISTQKMINQTDPSSSRYEQKHGGLVCAKPNHQVLAYISDWGGLFELCFFVLKLRVLLNPINPLFSQI